MLSENSDVIKIDTTGRQTTRPWVFNMADRRYHVAIELHTRRVYLNMRTEGIKAFSKQIRRCGMDGRKRYENGKCGRKYSWKRSKTASFSFENGLVWTEPSTVNVTFTTSLCRLITIANSVFALITEWFRITPRQPYWCPKTIERRPCWCDKPIILLQ